MSRGLYRGQASQWRMGSLFKLRKKPLWTRRIEMDRGSGFPRSGGNTGYFHRRGGSKRLPGKNLKLLLGKPLIQWAWDEARKSNYIDTLQLSSEDNEIICYAQANGMDGFQRPVELATDEASLSDVFLH